MSVKAMGIAVYQVKGIDHTCFAHKVDAEEATREEFPNEAIDLRHARISHLHLYAGERSSKEFAKRVMDSAVERFRENVRMMVSLVKLDNAATHTTHTTHTTRPPLSLADIEANGRFRENVRRALLEAQAEDKNEDQNETKGEK